MKKIILYGIVFLVQTMYAGKPIIITGLYNQVPKQTNYPLIGFVNVSDSLGNPLQLGFVNVTLQGGLSGLQLGFVSYTKEISGAQLGFVNTAPQFVKGLQLGFVSYTKEISGAQLGFVNVATKKLKGLQLGFVNVVDSLESGVPIGFLSVVKKGGYRALELSASEWYPIQLAFKIGVPKFYTGFVLAHAIHTPYFGAGVMAGTLIPVSKCFFMNPELKTMSNFSSNNLYFASTVYGFLLGFGFKPVRQFEIFLSPSISWERKYTNRFNSFEPWFALNKKLDSLNNLVGGLSLALRYSFAK